MVGFERAGRLPEIEIGTRAREIATGTREMVAATAAAAGVVGRAKAMTAGPVADG